MPFEEPWWYSKRLAGAAAPAPPAARRSTPTCRRDTEERAEQLKGISNLSALMAGFVLVSLLNFSFDPNQGSQGVQLAFGLTIALCVALEANSMVLCSLIHASVLKTARQGKARLAVPLHMLHSCRGREPSGLSAAATHSFRRRPCCATVCRSYVSAQEEADFMMRACEFALK